MLDSVKKLSILEICKATIQLYHNRGFNVRHIHADGAFACVANDIENIYLNIITTVPHVGETK
jgi:hypothetical protein